MHTTRRGLLALIAVVGATACGGGATGLVSLPPCASSATTGVVGCVTNSRGGPAVSGATITASGTTATATTDGQGAYALSVNPATYDILAMKPGMAASKFQGVIVQAGQATTANLIMLNVFDPTKLVAAPTITVSGLSQGQTVTATVSFTVNVTASNPVRRIDVRTSNMNAFVKASVADNSTSTFSLDSTLLANGSAFVDIFSTDLNNNAAELVINFTVSNAPSGAPPSTPPVLFLVAVTTGQSLGLFSAHRAQTFSALGLTQNPAILSINEHQINLLAAPSNSTLFVHVEWSPVLGAVGYKVYRSFSGAGPFAQVAQFSWSTLGVNPSYSDADPSLAPGITVYYRVSAYNAGGESARTSAVSVTPLPPFNLNLTSPPNNATGTATTPTFTWTPTAMVGTDQFYDISVQGLNDAFPAWVTSSGSLHNVTSVVYGAVTGFLSVNPLTSGKVYQWDIYQAQAQIIYSSFSAAVAVANGFAGGSLNGPFRLTTMP